MLPPVEQVHFIGIGGYGMSALAQVLLKMGYRVTGSDLKASPITERLSRQGAKIYCGHRREHVHGCGLAVYSTAIPMDNPEIQEVLALGLPLWHRSELLAGLLNDHFGIAVAGTHGKTTTTAMISLLLEQAGMDPTAIIGGEVASFGGNARLGQSRYLVAEACESDHSFLRYRPALAIVTNLEPDHLEHYDGDFEKLRRAYFEFLGNLVPGGTAVLCVDDPRLREMAPRLERKVVTYALEGPHESQADYVARNIACAGYESTFELFYRDAFRCRVELKVPGKHNVSNAAGALAVAAQLGADLEQCVTALAAFQGAGRRFEIVARSGGITVVNDYAHHPTEIRVTIQAARSGGGRVCCLFQPHRYTRTAYFFEDFARSFHEADLVLLHDIYPAGEKPIAGVSSEALARRIRELSGREVYYSPDLEVLEERALEFARPGDIILVMGAGDINQAAYNLRRRLQA